MTEWLRRSPEEAALFNPAFCAVLLECCAGDYIGEAERPLPFVLTFLALPIVLHKPTREALPAKKSSSLTTWMEHHPSVRVGFSERVKALSPVVREAMLFGVQHGRLALDREGALSVRTRRLPALSDDTAESEECKRKAHFVGRWFAASGSTATVMSVWGVSP
jgi:hypothetical protein